MEKSKEKYTYIFEIEARGRSGFRADYTRISRSGYSEDEVRANIVLEEKREGNSVYKLNLICKLTKEQYAKYKRYR